VGRQSAFLRVGLANGFHIGQVAQSAGLQLVLDQVFRGNNMYWYAFQRKLNASRPGVVEINSVDGLQNVCSCRSIAELEN
jgi:hypothetical protein